MEGKRLLHSISLKNLLSYGSEGVTLELEPLNVLIGPNASGKSNLVEALGLLAATPRDFLVPFREGGGAFADWLWKGSVKSPIASMAVVVDGAGMGPGPAIERLAYLISFTVSDDRLRIVKESLAGDGKRILDRGPLEVNIGPSAGLLAALPDPKQIARTKIDQQQSLLSQIRDPIYYRELTFVGDQLGRMSFFRGWPFGHQNMLRRAQDVNLPDDFLLEDAANLGLVINDLQNQPETKRLLLERFQQLYEGVADITTKVRGGTIQVLVHEKGLRNPVPASRLSDGVLHYLCLLAVLLHPEPPPLICIEEPELGLHPDVIPKIAKLLIDASQRAQLVVTTHSESLVSSLSEIPESVVICERVLDGTTLRRLERERLNEWLERYSLGELWAMGEVGGNRW